MIVATTYLVPTVCQALLAHFTCLSSSNALCAPVMPGTFHCNPMTNGLVLLMGTTETRGEEGTSLRAQSWQMREPEFGACCVTL